MDVISIYSHCYQEAYRMLCRNHQKGPLSTH